MTTAATPSDDDLAVALARGYGKPLVLYPALYERLAALFEARGETVPGHIKRQEPLPTLPGGCWGHGVVTGYSIEDVQAGFRRLATLGLSLK